MRLHLSVACGFMCLACLALVLPSSKAAPAPAKGADGKPIRILVPGEEKNKNAVSARLEQLKFDVVLVPWDKVEPDALTKIDVILLPTGWASDTERYKQLEAKKDQFHRFVKRGGGLLICQPNPLSPGTCTPELLPYPITFQNGYDKENPTRVNLNPAHFITEDLPGEDMPFPADPMIKVDKRYTLLAKQKSTDWPSLAVCPFGDGRVVVQTANESRGATIPIKDEILRRMVVWAAGREPAR